MKMVLLYGLLLFITANIISCITEKPTREVLTPAEPLTYEPYDTYIYVRIIENKVEITIKDSAEYIMETLEKRCGGRDTLLIGAWDNQIRWHNMDSCGHTRFI